LNAGGRVGSRKSEVGSRLRCPTSFRRLHDSQTPGQADQHPFHFIEVRRGLLQLAVRKHVEIVRENEEAFEFVGGASGDVDESGELFGSAPTTPLGEIRRYRESRSTGLRDETEPLGIRVTSRDLVHRPDYRPCLPPDLEDAIVEHISSPTGYVRRREAFYPSRNTRQPRRHLFMHHRLATSDSPMSRSIRRLLIANRGEIAVRVIRTARDMGIHTIAVYSELDRDALHVSFADEALNIGPAPASESYLNQEAILRVAREANADAIHPG